MSKSTKIILGVVASLSAIVATLAVLNFREMAERLDEHIEGSFRIVSGDDSRHISTDDLEGLSPMEISAAERGNLRNFRGLPLAKILEFSGLDHREAARLHFISMDGFRTNISMAEIGNAYIVFEEDGEKMPFMLVLPEDPFPNRWARYILEMILE
ncbi:MAG: hypothetical protein LBE35_08195 [Clostridiales bacterium]|jgi:hypothetical protein|nr:hypothetical protein [Clostridiales bacterium]